MRSERTASTNSATNAKMKHGEPIGKTCFNGSVLDRLPFSNVRFHLSRTRDPGKEFVTRLTSNRCITKRASQLHFAAISYDSYNNVRLMGLEPIRPFEHIDLNDARLPISAQALSSSFTDYA